MAVEHMVWIKFHEDIPEERQMEHLANLAGLKDRIDVIERIVVGENFTDRSGGFGHGLIVTVASRPDLMTYLDHPAHVEVATPLKADAELRAMDIEVV